MKGIHVAAFVLLVGVVSFNRNLLGFSMVLKGMIDDKAPSFTLEDTTDTIRSLSDFHLCSDLSITVQKDFLINNPGVGVIFTITHYKITGLVSLQIGS